ncbi:MAG: shikimate kinase [Oscillospiraceae bacterium]|nr:shikimate kinase [Oscillospiraceae bacterium]
MRCGLLGEKLGHSYSPQIHAELADYEYLLYEKAPEEVEEFVLRGDWHGLNVTIPYKKTVVPFCDELSETAEVVGSVNTLLRREDGTIFGDNTDAFGFETLLRRTFPADLSGKKALVLGTGGASVTVCAVLRKHGADVISVSRSGENNYGNLERHADVSLLVNTTPLGMYPNNGTKAVDLAAFPTLEAVLDVVYNPARTALLLQAEELGIPCAGGLTMLVAQAKRSAEIFLGRELPDSELVRITKLLSQTMQNIILIGMPGSGKSCIANLLADRLGRPCMEADAELEKAAGKSIPEIFEQEGEAGFRARETEILAALGKLSGIVLSTGGGCVTRPENYPLLHQNGTIFRLDRELDHLAREGRPLSRNADLKQMFAVRDPLYERFADYTVDNNGEPEQTVQTILEVLQ